MGFRRAQRGLLAQGPRSGSWGQLCLRTGLLCDWACGTEARICDAAVLGVGLDTGQLRTLPLVSRRRFGPAAVRAARSRRVCTEQSLQGRWLARTISLNPADLREAPRQTLRRRERIEDAGEEVDSARSKVLD